METKVWLFCTFHCESKSTLLLVHFFSLFTHSIVFGNFKKWNEKHTNEQQESSKRVRNGWSNDATTTAAEKSNVFRFRWHTKCEHSTSRTTWLARRSLIHCFLVVCTCWLVLSSYIPSPDAAADGIYEKQFYIFSLECYVWSRMKWKTRTQTICTHNWKLSSTPTTQQLSDALAPQSLHK